ncbi:hypothetical protein ACHAXS_004963 [Conticribra weissflogii]
MCGFGPEGCISLAAWIPSALLGVVARPCRSVCVIKSGMATSSPTAGSSISSKVFGVPFNAMGVFFTPGLRRSECPLTPGGVVGSRPSLHVLPGEVPVVDSSPLRALASCSASTATASTRLQRTL